MILRLSFFLFALSSSLFAEKPNVLLIAIDDLNDWVGCLNGHPQTNNPLFPALRSDPLALSGASRRKQIPSSREKCGLNLVVLTRGAVGALLVSDQGTIDQSGIPAKVVDTVGAGDCFIATFLLGLLRGEPHQDILRKACDKASAVCAYSGAIPS